MNRMGFDIMGLGCRFSCWVGRGNKWVNLEETLDMVVG